MQWPGRHPNLSPRCSNLRSFGALERAPLMSQQAALRLEACCTSSTCMRALDPPSGRETSAVLQCSVAENGLANDLFKRVPELDEDFQALVQQVCRGFFDVEEILLSTDWGALDLGTTLPLIPLLPPLAFGGSGNRSRVNALHEVGVTASTTSGRRTSLRNVGPHVGELHE